MMTKDMWERIGGLNPLYVGWGLEDDDTRQRVRTHGYEWYRPESEVGTFFILPHDDNHQIEDKNYLKNVDIVAKNFQNNLTYGYKDSKGIVTTFETEIDNLRWIKNKMKEFPYITDKEYPYLVSRRIRCTNCKRIHSGSLLKSLVEEFEEQKIKVVFK